MYKAYKYRLLPNESQVDYLERLFRACRFLYNLGLETKNRAWQSARKSLSAYDLMKQITELKHTDCPWLKEFYCPTLESEMIHLESAFKRFYAGCGFPKFKNRSGRQSAEFRKGIKVNGNQIYFPKLGNVTFVNHRQFSGSEIKTATVSKEQTGKYFISIMVKVDCDIPEKPSINQDAALGIDVGLKSFATFSDGSKVDNPKYLNEELKRLRIEQRKLARRFRKGAKEQSKGYYSQRLAVAKLHERIRNKRTDFLQKLSTEIIRNNDTVCVESLNISGIKQNGCLGKSISDAGWAEFIRMLKYKGEWYGKNIIEIGMFEPSSKTCSNCGYHHKELTLKDRTWDCA